jgi:hypothetical protein
MKRNDKWLKMYPMINCEKADIKKIKDSVGDKLSEQKEVIYMKQKRFKTAAIIGAIVAVSAVSVFTVNAATGGAIVDKITETWSNVKCTINGEEVEMPAKVKEVGDDYIIYEFDVDESDSSMEFEVTENAGAE